MSATVPVPVRGVVAQENVRDGNYLKLITKNSQTLVFSVQQISIVPSQLAVQQLTECNDAGSGYFAYNIEVYANLIQ